MYKEKFAERLRELIGAESVSSVAKNGLLKEGGRIIYEHSGKSLGDIDGVRLVDSRVYGIAVFDFYECL